MGTSAANASMGVGMRGMRVYRRSGPPVSRSGSIEIPQECSELEALARLAPSQARFEELARVDMGLRRFPVTGVFLGPDDPTRPLLIVVGGVHGLERIGSRVVLSFLRTMLERVSWDETLQRELERARMLFIPVLNPGGIALGLRSNPKGVDLMRNAPTPDSSESTPLIGGHRISPWLPWYRGDEQGRPELETSALLDTVAKHAHKASSVVSIDVHSGFGLQDRLWFPYARTRAPMHHLAEVGRIAELLDAAHPQHIYRIEPQAQAYTISGDLWDFMYDAYREANPVGTFVPLTLEMGSWLWVKKNPRQLTSRDGPFNPQRPHRERRIRRRHFTLLDFLWRCVASPSAWAVRSDEARAQSQRDAFARWYAA